MLEGVDGKRLLAMLPQELRWMDNLKKAIFDSDSSILDGTAPDRAFPAICNAVDVAATLRLSLLSPVESWVRPSMKNNRDKFVDFLHLEIPEEDEKGLSLTLFDVHKQSPRTFSFGAIIYAIRCAVHENENLNADEQPDFHVSLDWNLSEHDIGGRRIDGRFACNARLFLGRVREVLVKFITCTDAFMGFERGVGKFSMTSQLPLGSIHPGDGRHRVE